MIRKHLTTVICLVTLALINFFSLFEVSSSSQLESHFFHQSFTGSISIIFLMVYFRQQLFQSAGKFSKYKAIVVVVLLFFTFIHLAPAKISLAFHHQSESQDGFDHPCCMTQVTVLSPSLEIEPINLEFDFFHEVSQIYVPLYAKDINNKSPPLS
jgi:hypothetical protein